MGQPSKLKAKAKAKAAACTTIEAVLELYIRAPSGSDAQAVYKARWVELAKTENHRGRPVRS